MDYKNHQEIISSPFCLTSLNVGGLYEYWKVDSFSGLLPRLVVNSPVCPSLKTCADPFVWSSVAETVS